MNLPPTCRGEKTTLKREMLNLLVWAMPALKLSEDEASTELHKEHHSRSAGLNQRLAEAERDEWGGLIQRALTRQQDDEERKNENSNQLEEKRAGIPQESEQSNLQSKQWLSESSETDHDGKQASNSRRRDDKDDPGQTPERRLA